MPRDIFAALFRERLATSRRTQLPTHPSVLTTANNLGMLLGDMGQWDEAEALLVEALAGHTKMLGELLQWRLRR